MKWGLDVQRQQEGFEERRYEDGEIAVCHPSPVGGEWILNKVLRKTMKSLCQQGEKNRDSIHGCRGCVRTIPPGSGITRFTSAEKLSGSRILYLKSKDKSPTVIQTEEETQDRSADAI